MIPMKAIGLNGAEQPLKSIKEIAQRCFK